MKLIKKLKGFTLVELIIVITILAILATIAFVSFQGYVKDSRDSTRLTTLKNIESGLQAFQINTGNYPEPENYTLIQASGTTISYQGYIGDTISKMIKINKTPLDPIDQTKFIYSSNAQKNKYQLLSYLESQNKLSYINNTFAVDYTQRTPKAIGDSVGLLLDTTNNPVSGTAIDILKANSGSVYKVYFSNTQLTLSGKQIISFFMINDKKLSHLDSNLVLHFDMETFIQSGGLFILKDLSSFGNNGFCFNNGLPISCGLNNLGPQIFESKGITGNSMIFDGIDDYINVLDHQSLSFTDNIFTFVIKFKSNSSSFGLISKGANDWEYSIFGTGGEISYFTWPISGTFPVYGLWNGMTTSYKYGGNDTLFWSSDGNMSKVYLNMIKTIEYIKGSYNLENGTKDLKIGFGRNAPTSVYHNGIIDEIYIFNKSFSYDELTELYSAIK